MQLKRHGGTKEEAYIEDINLAYPLEDGMKIKIPTKQEKENDTTNHTSETEEIPENYLITSSGMEGDSIQQEGKEKTEAQNAKVNINTATQVQLETLPGIGPSTATKIISHRQENGKFAKIEDIKEVSGIGDSKYNKIKDLISVK